MEWSALGASACVVVRQVQGRIRSQQATWPGEDGLDFGKVEELRRCLEGEGLLIW